MTSIAGVGLPNGADRTGLNSHSRAKADGHACGRSVPYVGISFIGEMIAQSILGPHRKVARRRALLIIGGGMALYKLGDISPTIAASAYVAPSAAIVGNVVLAEHSSVWFGATLRGDNETISIGVNSNVQDGAVLHTDPGFPLLVGTHVSIGHQAMLHGCTVGDGSLIGIQAVVLNAAMIGKGCLVGAGAVITERKIFADGTLIIGAPAKVVRELTAEERENLLKVAANYAARGAYYRKNLHLVDEA
jgi:carbonic anhydrase/acetyltransferase-like protein (isoleucine patch superfamily)